MSPATIFSSVDLPQPIVPRIETNSPRSTESDTSDSTSRDAPPEVANVFATCDISIYAMRSDGSQPGFRNAHQSIEHEAHDADRQDGEEDVCVDQAVVFLPQKAADAGRARQHLAG